MITGEAMLEELIKLEPSRLDEDTQKLFYTIMKVIDERDELKEKVHLLNKTNEKNYNNYCEMLNRWNELKKWLEEERKKDDTYFLPYLASIHKTLDKIKKIEGESNE